MPTTTETHIEGDVERIVYQDPRSGWGVVRLRVAGRGDPLTLVGDLLGTRAGERLRARGQLVHDERYGEQFAVRALSTLLPTTLAGLERYLGSGVARGVGPATAARLVRTFGSGTLEVLEQHPERLTEVPGIGPKRARTLHAAWNAERDLRDLSILLQSHGISATMARRIHRQYGEASLSTLREDPYRLSREVHGLGFRTADRIAGALGTAPDAPVRLQAGLEHLLAEASGEGHLFLRRGELLERALELLALSPDTEPALDRALASLSLTGRVRIEPGPCGQDAVYLRHLHDAEVSSAARLRGLLGSPRPLPVALATLESRLRAFEAGEEHPLDPAQRAAVREALRAPVTLLTGGPGTGKTTVLRALLASLEGSGLRVRLAAPTGRAARRMEEATGAPASTLHRLLEFDPRQGFRRHATRPLTGDLVVVDESSMVDQELFRALLDALEPGTRVLLVGDPDQLPSVGPGEVLRQLVACGSLPVVRLETVFRQSGRSLVVRNAHRIRAGRLPTTVAPTGTRGDFDWILADEPEEIRDAIVELVVRRLPRDLGVDPVREVQVLAPMRRGGLGTDAWNPRLQALLCPPGPEVRRGPLAFRAGDKVMQTRNDAERRVFNGDTGIVEAVAPEEQTLWVRFEDRLLPYADRHLGGLTHAYACTIHKAQGSEYPVVVLPLHTQHFPMLRRDLLYTAVTRARRKLVVVGPRKAMAIAVKQNQERGRNTRLGERLRALLGEPPSGSTRAPGSLAHRTRRSA